MSLLRRFVGLLPPKWIRAISDLQFRLPFLAPLIRRAGQTMASGEGVIQNGLGQGLRFDATGGYAGYLLGTSEPEEQETLARYLKPGGVFYDIGANIGFYTVIGAKIVGESGRVYAFEPFPEATAALRKNVALNDFKTVEVVEAAVSDTVGKAQFAGFDQSAKNRIVSGQKGADVESTIEVDLVTIDDFVDKTGARPPDVIMIDIEGAETAALLGMGETLKKWRPAILCEVHWLGEKMIERFEETLRPLGYEMTTYTGKPVPEGLERYHALLTVKQSPS